MNKLLRISKITMLTLFLVSISVASKGQDDIGELVKAGKEDATKLAQAYLNPFFKGFGFGMNSGWFNSAKTKNLGRFDLRIQATGAFVPASDQRFDVSSLGLSNTRVKAGQSNFTPTIFGDDNSASTIEVLDDNGDVAAEFQMPQGTGYNIAPSPQVQLTIGLIKNTDVSVRFVPSVKIGDGGQINSWGVGIKKEITSFLPGKSEKVIPVDISLAFGYNQVNVDYKIAVEDQVNYDNEVGGPNQGRDLNQRVESKLSGFTVDAILSKKLAIFTPFISVGYNTAKTEVGVLGDYIIKTGSGVNDKETIKDPIKINQKDISGMRAGVGFSLHLAIFRLYGAYNIGEYNAVTAGLGIGIGK
ncbi:DUF6588 family protein [Pedobacter glucosidilyticus]|uniref:DUF6588 family protein n=1 Tax=Pedobacter glucosidilyticus TaxID=1122941 RepID=UPI000401B64C|nr:DUF6588 family protein [Pedobacter glucosidilyticus]